MNPSQENPQGLSWQANFSLSDVAGVASLVTGFSIDGTAQPLAATFPAPAIQANGTVNASVVLYNLPAPVTKKFSVSGIDSAGNTFLRNFNIEFLPLGSFFDFLMTAAPLTPVQDIAVSPSCQWPVRWWSPISAAAVRSLLTTLQVGGVDRDPQIAAIFGTTRLNPYAALQGTVCFGGLTAPATVPIYIALDSGAFNEIYGFVPTCARYRREDHPNSCDAKPYCAKLDETRADNPQSGYLRQDPTLEYFRGTKQSRVQLADGFPAIGSGTSANHRDRQYLDAWPGRL